MNSIDEKSFDIIGQNRPRIDARDKATGRTRYAADLKVAGCLHGKVLRSPFPHARVLAIDTSRAERLAGVRAVATYRDTPDLLYGSYNSGIKDELILARDRVRFVGDEVAAVAAVDQETALEALSLIRVEYEPLPGYYDPETAMAEGAQAIHPVRNNVASHRIVVRGDPSAGFQAADLVLEDRFRTDLQIHAYLEPVACIADYDSRSRFHLWAPLQNPSWARIIFAEAMELPIGKFHCVQTPIGGAFGGKLEQKLYLIAFLLARKSGKPVRLENTREEEFQTSMPRVPMIIDLKIGMRKDGLITAKEHRIIAENGAYAKYAPAVTHLGTYRIDGLYRIKNIRNECTLTYTNRPPTSAFRGFGNPQATFAVESMIDMLCHELNLDPMAVRLNNAALPGDVTAHGFKLISCGFKPALEQINKEMAYPESRRNPVPDEGVGLSGTSHVCGNRGFFPLFDGATTFIRIDEGGNVRVIVGETDVGQGLLTAFAMIAAEEMGVSLERITVDDCDTDRSAFGLGTWGDRATFIGGNAVKVAAVEARKAILDVAAEMLEAAVPDLVLQNDRAFVKGSPERSLTFEEIAAHAVYTGGGSPIMVKGTFVPDSEKADESLFGNISGTYAFGAQGCRVRVDRLTGEIEVLDFYASHDVGRAINPMACEGQVQGSIAQGIGYGLLERVEYKDGVMLNPRFLDYGIPTALDMPPIHSYLVETIDPAGPFGAKGVAEPAMTPTAVCIANAVFDAVGIRIKELPLTPEKILKALKKRKRNDQTGNPSHRERD
jgi:CO/xanthine dehydrogenase Mo-binding subunit